MAKLKVIPCGSEYMGTGKASKPPMGGTGSVAGKTVGTPAKAHKVSPPGKSGRKVNLPTPTGTAINKG